MSEIIEPFLSQPWYLLLFALAGGAYFVYENFKQGMDSVNKNEVSYRYAKEGVLGEGEQAAIALDAVMTAYWEVDNNTLSFTHKGKKPHNFNKYMSGWFIDTTDGYGELRDYFLTDGRRSYFNFIYPLYKSEPKNNWPAKMMSEYGNADRPCKILTRLSEYKVIDELVRKGVIQSEAEMSLGVVGWDVSVLIGQARRAYTAGLVTEEEARDTIAKAAKMARDNFGSWQDFGKSQVIGMALDYYHHDDTFFNDFIETYHQVMRDAESPWKTVVWR
jgi:hypothetical protein